MTYPYPSRDELQAQARQRDLEKLKSVLEGVRDGQVGIIEGARKIARFQGAMPSQWNEIRLFVGIDSECDCFPGSERELWNPDVLKVELAKMRAYEEKIRSHVIEACEKALVTI